jgi:hypothetical protein
MMGFGACYAGSEVQISRVSNKIVIPTGAYPEALALFEGYGL